MDLSFEADANIDSNDGIDIAMMPTTGDTDTESEAVVNIVTSPKKRNKFEWRIDTEGDDLDEALDRLENEGFVIYDQSDLKCGQKFYFRCKHIPKERKVWCRKRYTVFLPSHNLKVHILCNQFEHDHETLLAGQVKPPSDEIINFITDLFKCGTTKVNDVIQHIDLARTKRNLFTTEANPGKRQIEYMLRKFRNAEAPPVIKLGELVDWCEQHKEFPSNVDESFVFGYESSTYEEQLNFRFAFSTPFLLQMAMNLKTICIDATYKLNWLGFPLMVMGTVDRAKRFHPFAYACCSHEKTSDFSFIFKSVKAVIKKYFNFDFLPKILIADGADPIRNAFYECFESAELDVMCYAHVKRNCRKRPFSSQINKALVLDDIQKIQGAPNRSTFDLMTKLFCKKWESAEPDFVPYFIKEWLGSHCNWFEGAADYTASTNNGQEGHNAVIKKNVTLRKRLPMNQFLVCMMNMTSDISKQFSKSERALAVEPKIKMDVFERATLMVMKNFKAFKAKQASSSNIVIYSVPSSRCVDASESYFKALVKATWESFDDFIVHGYHQFYITKFSLGNWKVDSTCTCIEFFKQHACKHIIAIGIRLNVIEAPTSANPVRLAATKRKPGRPKRTMTALSKQI